MEIGLRSQMVTSRHGRLTGTEEGRWRRAATVWDWSTGLVFSYVRNGFVSHSCKVVCASRRSPDLENLRQSLGLAYLCIS